TGPNGYTVADRICDLGGLALTWKTAPVPSSFNEGNVTFAFYAGVGTRFGWNAPFQLNLNGKTVLSGLPVMNGQLVFTDESSVLLQQKASTDGGLWTEGVFWVTVPAIWITPGQPATFSLQYLGPLMTGGCYYNFYLFEFPDVASFEYAYQSNTAQGGTFPLTRIGTNLGIPFDFFPPQGLGLSSQTTSRLVNLNTVSSGFSSPAMTRVWDQLWRQNPKYSREEIWSALDAWLSRQAARPPSVSTVVQANATPVPIATPSPSATPAPTTLRPLNTEAKQQITDMLDGYNLFYQTFQKTAQESGRMIDTFRMNTDVSLAETTLCKQYFQKGDPYWSIGNGELFVPVYLVTLCQTPDKNFQTSRKLVTTCLSGNGVTVDLELFNWIKSLGTKVNTQAVPVCDVSDSQVTVRLFLPGGFIGVGEYRYSLSPSGQRSDNAQSEAALNAVFLGFSAFPALRSLSPQRQLVYKGTHVVENGRLVTVNVHATNPPVPDGASPFATTIADFSLSVFQDWMESLIAHAEKT
ncbi:MAG TPA: hypothetical protein VI874_02300, partial [Candidatus Norongarragalinales archaeon]|nr:hypothetical protein [Candidatus Norongarragalinales archaeon]